MKMTLKNFGWKLYGLYYSSKIGLFNRPLIIFDNVKTKEQIITKLKSAGFKDNDEVAIRFSKSNTLNLPFFLGRFTLQKVAEIIEMERKDTTSFVHGLVKTKFSVCLYYNGETIFLELWPGIGASKKKVFNENPDFIKINSEISIARYLRNRTVEDTNGNAITKKPFEMSFLISFSKKIKSFEKQLKQLLKIQNPLLCEFNCESLNDINLMGFQKTNNFDVSIVNSKIKHFYIAKSLNDLKKYDGSKELFFDIPLSRNYEDWTTIVNSLKNFPKVYVKSLTMHLSIILREFGINVEKGVVSKDYEIKEVGL